MQTGNNFKLTMCVCGDKVMHHLHLDIARPGGIRLVTYQKRPADDVVSWMDEGPHSVVMADQRWRKIPADSGKVKLVEHSGDSYKFKAEGASLKGVYSLSRQGVDSKDVAKLKAVDARLQVVKSLVAKGLNSGKRDKSLERQLRDVSALAIVLKHKVEAGRRSSAGWVMMKIGNL